MSALADYYAAQAAEKQANIPLLAAQTRAANINASNIDQNDAARRGLEGAQSFATGQQGGLFKANAGVVGPNAASEIANRDSLTAENVAKTKTIGPAAGSDLLTQAVARAVQGQGFTPLGQLGAFGLGAAAFGQGNKGLNADRLPNVASTGQPMSVLTPSATPSQQPADDTLPPGFKKPVIDNTLVGFSQGGIVPAFTRTQRQQAQGFAKGTATVAPKATSKPAKIAKSDTVPAMLTPGEAVLNKGAVDHYGPGVIGHMNRMGLLRHAAHKEHQAHMKKAGIVNGKTRAKPSTAKAAPMMPQGFAKGVETVRPLLALYLGLDQGAPHLA